MPDNKTDVLIVGCGIAGGSAALTAAKAGVSVTILTRSKDLCDSNTCRAQGGIVYKGINDSAEILEKDINQCGAGIGNDESIQFISKNAESYIDQILIDELKIPFNRKDDEMFDFANEGAHSRSRILHVGDQTGKYIEQKLIHRLQEFSNVTFRSEMTAVDLLTLSHHSMNYKDVYQASTCIGVFALNQNTGRVEPLFAKKTVLATGGVGQIYLHSTNPIGARGDGIAMAYRAGVRVINLEFIQFHPTSLYTKDSERFLISETLRGSGAKLLNFNGDEFMGTYHEQKELAPRDIVSRSIHQEMFKGKSPHVWLDISFKDSEWTKSRYPTIYKTCLDHGYDITKDMIPVVPAAHYSCGGIFANTRGETTMTNLFAVGETACIGLHGANRLASMSLLEGLIVGSTCGTHIVNKLDKGNNFPEIRPWSHGKEIVDRALIYQDWLTIKHTMWNYVGLSRNNRRLCRAKDMLLSLYHEIESFYGEAQMTDELIALRNAAVVSLLITQAALQNKQSIGCHYIET